MWVEARFAAKGARRAQIAPSMSSTSRPCGSGLIRRGAPAARSSTERTVRRALVRHDQGRRLEHAVDPISVQVLVFLIVFGLAVQRRAEALGHGPGVLDRGRHSILGLDVGRRLRWNARSTTSDRLATISSAFCCNDYFDDYFLLL